MRFYCCRAAFFFILIFQLISMRVLAVMVPDEPWHYLGETFAVSVLSEKLLKVKGGDIDKQIFMWALPAHHGKGDLGNIAFVCPQGEKITSTQHGIMTKFYLKTGYSNDIEKLNSMLKNEGRNEFLVMGEAAFLPPEKDSELDLLQKFLVEFNKDAKVMVAYTRSHKQMLSEMVTNYQNLIKHGYSLARPADKTARGVTVLVMPILRGSESHEQLRKSASKLVAAMKQEQDQELAKELTSQKQQIKLVVVVPVVDDKEKSIVVEEVREVFNDAPELDRQMEEVDEVDEVDEEGPSSPKRAKHSY